jgi:hypothetical protein
VRYGPRSFLTRMIVIQGQPTSKSLGRHTRTKSWKRSSARGSARRGKPAIPDDLARAFLQVNYEKQLLADVLVHSTVPRSSPLFRPSKFSACFVSKRSERFQLVTLEKSAQWLVARCSSRCAREYLALRV